MPKISLIKQSTESKGDESPRKKQIRRGDSIKKLPSTKISILDVTRQMSFSKMEIEKMDALDQASRRKSMFIHQRKKLRQEQHKSPAKSE